MSTSIKQENPIVIKSLPNNRSSTKEWRKNLPGLVDKLSFIFEENYFTDVSFLVGEKKELISCHKLILIASSSVFEAMLNGDLAGNVDIIKIPEIEPKIFKLLIKYLYKGEVEEKVCPDDVLNLLYTAKKYNIQELTEKCSSLLLNEMTIENVFTIFHSADILDECLLFQNALEFLVHNFDFAIKEDDFLNLSIKNLSLLLEKDLNFVSELDIFTIILKWANTECGRNKLEINSNNLRFVLSDIINLIRFPLMTDTEFAMNVVPTGILTDKETVEIFQYMALSKEKKNKNNSNIILPEVTFSDKSRRSATIFKAHLYKPLEKKAKSFGDMYYYNMFKTDRPVSIVSVGFYGPFTRQCNDNVNYEIDIQFEEGEKFYNSLPLAKISKIVNVWSKEIFHIKFDSPINIRANVLYTISFIIRGPATYYSDNPIPEVAVDCGKSGQVTFYHKSCWYQLPEINFVI